MKHWMISRGYNEWTSVIGLRLDEPERVAKALAPQPERWENMCPLHTAGITKADVMRFWETQRFDLKLRPWEGNCDLCFLKGQDKRRRVMADRPDLAAWWIEKEREMMQPFRAHGPSYATLLRQTQRQPRLPLIDAEDPTDIGSCVCTD